MEDFSSKSYGRNQEVSDIFLLFENNRDIAMPGPRRLGKTFVLERVVEAAKEKGWVAVKVEVAGCTDPNAFLPRA